jgi:hypothetical protein
LLLNYGSQYSEEELQKVEPVDADDLGSDDNKSDESDVVQAYSSTLPFRDPKILAGRQSTLDMTYWECHHGKRFVPEYTPFEADGGSAVTLEEIKQEEESDEGDVHTHTHTVCHTHTHTHRHTHTHTHTHTQCHTHTHTHRSWRRKNS